MKALRNLAALKEYAREQIKTADVLLSAHEEIELDLCRCGRAEPCNERGQGLQMREHYVQIVGDGS